jgi:N-acetylmuramic acid 6-phosphate etherase
VRLTGDGELLTAPALGGGPQRFVTFICGTGSLALLWDYKEGRAEQVARSGGWGPLLDDAGSGWALGKEAVKSVLTFAANRRELRAWHRDLLAHFGLDRTTGADRLIAASSRLDPERTPADGDAERKKRIAGCSRIVVAAAEGGDDEAVRLLGVVAEQVCATLAPLEAGLEETMIVVAGGLGQVEAFWGLVEKRFEERGWRFQTVKMPEPGRSGLEALLK